MLLSLQTHDTVPKSGLQRETVLTPTKIRLKKKMVTKGEKTIVVLAWDRGTGEAGQRAGLRHASVPPDAGLLKSVW